MAKKASSTKKKSKAPARAGKAKPTVKPAKSEKRRKELPYMAELRTIADFCTENGLTEFEFENDKIRVRLSKVAGLALATSAPVVHQAPAAPAVAAPKTVSAPVEESAPAETATDDGLHKITSPIVGTFYRASGPDKEPFVKEGSKIGPETTVCIVEAMKLMNEIQAEVSGEIVAVYVENGQPVEYGQPLFGVKK